MSFKRGFRRKRMGFRKSRRQFRKYSGTHKRNFRATPMRGGFRI